ncbi:MAG: gamma carbonic anhydrase family protein [Chlorobiota bacterium]|nr:MAG: gamma carbonic anhydrase family protein [Chlorobiota bacterium]
MHGCSHALILPYNGITPTLDPSVVVLAGAVIVGNVAIGEQSSVWFNCVIRGDVHSVTIGRRTNIQDLSMLHVTNGKFSLSIGDDVTVGHRAIVHGCTVQDRVLIGMGAVLLDGCVVESGSIIAAGAVVREGDVIPPGVLVAGVPARVIRTLSDDEQAALPRIAADYVKYAQQYRALLVPTESGSAQ